MKTLKPQETESEEKYDLTEIKTNPYEYVCDYVESIYPKVGKKTFEILSLMPCSLLIPDFPFGSKKVRSNISALFLASSGAGKTSISEIFSTFTFSPLKVESITSAKLESAIMQVGGFFSLVVGDFARMSRDPVLVKVIEGILGEEKSVSRRTMKKDIEANVEAIALLCGVANDLSKYILSGIIFRVVPIMISHSEKDHSAIGEHIKGKIGNGTESDKEEIIKSYYLQLAKNQSGEGDLPLVKGYYIKEEYREQSYSEWDKLTRNMVKDIGFNFFRELQEFFRFLCASAFLNSYNRRIEKGILYPNDDDFKIALKLMKQSLIFKFRLLKAESFSKGIRDAKEFRSIMSSDKIPEQYKDLIRNLVTIKEGKASLNR